MKSKFNRNISVLLVLYAVIILIFQASLVNVNPVSETIHQLVDEIKEYKIKNGVFPENMDFASPELLSKMKIFNIEYSKDELRIQSHGSFYYDYSSIYILTLGIFGKKTVVSDFGYNLKYLDPVHKDRKVLKKWQKQPLNYLKMNHKVLSVN